MLKSTNLYIRLHGFLKTAFIDFSKGTVCNSRLLFLSLFPHTSVHTSRESNKREHVEEKNENWGISWLKDQLKDFICLFFFVFFFSHLPVQHYFLNSLKPSLCFSTDRRPQSEVTVKQSPKDAVLTGERHLELPATSPIIPRKISSGRFIKRFSTPSMNELLFRQLVCSIKYS